MKNNILLELKKYDLKSLYKITFGFAFIPFSFTCIFIFTKMERLVIDGITLDYFSQNNTGAWAALLYPFFAIIFIQLLIEVEKKTNSLLYYKAYKKNWISFINKKVAIAFVFLLILTLLNIITNTIILYFADYYIQDKEFEAVLLDAIKTFCLAPLSLIPVLYFHSLLVYFFSNSYISFALGLIFIIVGIPLVNVGDFYYDVYVNGIAISRESSPTFFLVAWGIVVIIVSTLGSNLVLKR